MVPHYTYHGTIELRHGPHPCPVIGHSTSLLLPLLIIHCRVHCAKAEACSQIEQWEDLAQTCAGMR